jgi:YMGG-like Gly-zipper
MKKGVLGILFAAVAVLPAASADTLRLRSGKSVDGVFLSADSSEVKFLEPGGQPKTYALASVEAITFAALPAPASAALPPSPKSANVTVLAGTSIMVRTLSSIDTSQNRTGDLFTASLESNLVANGVLVARKGATVHGKVTKSQQARRLTGSSELQLALINIVINGSAHPLSTGDFQQAGANEGASTVKKTAVGAGLGAAIGAISGNAGRGAAIGAVSGLGVSMIKKGEAIRVPSETLLDFRLNEPVLLPATH